MVVDVMKIVTDGGIVLFVRWKLLNAPEFRGKTEVPTDDDLCSEESTDVGFLEIIE